MVLSHGQQGGTPPPSAPTLSQGLGGGDRSLHSPVSPPIRRNSLKHHLEHGPLCRQLYAQLWCEQVPVLQPAGALRVDPGGRALQGHRLADDDRDVLLLTQSSGWHWKTDQQGNTFPEPPPLVPLPRAGPHSPVRLQGDVRAAPQSRAPPPTPQPRCWEEAGDARGYLHRTSRVASRLSSPTALLATHVYVPESWTRAVGRDSMRPPERICASPRRRKSPDEHETRETRSSWAASQHAATEMAGRGHKPAWSPSSSHPGDPLPIHAPRGRKAQCRAEQVHAPTDQTWGRSGQLCTCSAPAVVFLKARTRRRSIFLERHPQ